MNLSRSFVENLITVAITAALIPLVFRVIDARKLKRQREEDEFKQRKQKEFEAELSRQSKVIDAQVQFIEQFSNFVWEYQLMAIAVSYYHQFNLSDQYQKASKEYLDNAGILLGKIRAEISKSLRLSSKSTYESLRHLYYEELLALDLTLTGLIDKPDRSRQIGGASWSSFNKYAVNELSEKVDKTILLLASEFGLNGQFSAPSKANAAAISVSNHLDSASA